MYNISKKNINEQKINEYNTLGSNKKEYNILDNNSSINMINKENFKFNLIGFINFGETYYMNTIIQILIHYNYFMEKLYKNYNKENSLSYSLLKLYYKQNQSVEYSFISPALFKDIFTKINLEFSE